MIKAGLFRMNILCNEDRKNFLEKSKDLKDTEFGNIFIRRDLTFEQRAELRQRRLVAAASRAENEERQNQQAGDNNQNTDQNGPQPNGSETTE